MNLFYFNFKEYLQFFYEYLWGPKLGFRSHSSQVFWAIMSQIIFPLVMIWQWALLLADDIFYPQIRKTTIAQPLFIIGNFRTGSTFLQRLLNKDIRTFSSIHLWELLFAPSYIGRRLVIGFKVLDTLLGSPVQSLFTWLNKQVVRILKSHGIALSAPEEDETMLVYTFTSSFLLLFAQEIKGHLHKFLSYENYSLSRKKADMDFLRGHIQRHLYYHRKAQYYLCKNPAFTPRCQSILRAFPNARFLYLLRDPREVLSSCMDWFSEVWDLLQKKGGRFPYTEFLYDYSKHWLVDMTEVLQTFPSDQVKFLQYNELVNNPSAVISDLYNWLNIPISNEFWSVVIKTETDQRKRRQRERVVSSEDFDNNKISSELMPVYELLSNNSRLHLRN